MFLGFFLFLLLFFFFSFTFHLNNEEQDSHLVIHFQELELKEKRLPPYALKKLTDGGN